MRAIIYLLLFYILFTLVVYSISSGADHKPYAEGPGYVLDGPQVIKVNDISTDRHLGKYVIVPYFSTYCPPCMKSLPKLAKLYEQNKHPDVVIVGIAIEPRNGEARLLKVLRKAKFSEGEVICEYQGWYSKIASQNGIKHIPYYALLSRDGNVIAKGSSFGHVFSTLRHRLKEDMKK
jgi:thiol-disulfide isomerase/thioredoxin